MRTEHGSVGDWLEFLLEEFERDLGDSVVVGALVITCTFPALGHHETNFLHFREECSCQGLRFFPFLLLVAVGRKTVIEDPAKLPVLGDCTTDGLRPLPIRIGDTCERQLTLQNHVVLRFATNFVVEVLAETHNRLL